MSFQDARLSQQERAALASLEAAAAADDPQLAGRLSGTAVVRARAAIPRLLASVTTWWRRAERYAWMGGPIAATGFALMVVGQSAGLAVGIVGAILAAGGLTLVAHSGQAWIVRRFQSGSNESERETT
jgi:hypothetical protein